MLLGTEIDGLVRKRVRGLVARAGGTVDQLVDYRNCSVEDINIPDGGCGKLLSASGGASIMDSLRFLRKTAKQELKFIGAGHRVPRDRKTIVLDMHGAHSRPELNHRYECSISSNVLEHSPNTIQLLLNFYFITKKGGFQFHAIPHCRYTYDRFREPTALSHFIDDFEKRIDASDRTHVEDYRQSAVEKDGWQRKFHEKYPIEYPFMHFHVFDERNTKALFEFVFEDVVNDIYKTDAFSDNVVLFSNTLNPAFAEKYRDALKEMGV